jgi:hypothetical protein
MNARRPPDHKMSTVIPFGCGVSGSVYPNGYVPNLQVVGGQAVLFMRAHLGCPIPRRRCRRLARCSAGRPVAQAEHIPVVTYAKGDRTIDTPVRCCESTDGPLECCGDRGRHAARPLKARITLVGVPRWMYVQNQ